MEDHEAQGIADKRGWARFERSGLLLHRRPRSRARNRADDAGSEDRTDGVEPAGRRHPVGQVRSRQQRARRRAPRGVRLPAGQQGTRLGVVEAMREIGNAHGGSRLRGSPSPMSSPSPSSPPSSSAQRRMEQLDDNLEAAKLTLTAAELKKLDEVSALPPEYPGLDAGTSGRRTPPAAQIARYDGRIR